MISKNKLITSVIVVNYNNQKRISRCINSLIKQTYKIDEIIFVDDNSSDNSLNELRNFKKKIIKIKITKKTNIPSYDQMNAYYRGFNKSKGNVIFFLDSDDYFNINKAKTIIKYFKKNNKVNLIFDKPIIYFNKKKFYKYNFKNRGTIFTPWPRFSPQSCISIRRNYLKKIFRNLNIKKYPTVWFDFRIAFQSYIDYKKINFINRHLTYYQQSSNSASSQYARFSKNWWKRRKEAHNFVKYLSKKNDRNIKSNLDELITNTFNFILK